MLSTRLAQRKSSLRSINKSILGLWFITLLMGIMSLSSLGAQEQKERDGSANTKQQTRGQAEESATVLQKPVVVTATKQKSQAFDTSLPMNVMDQESMDERVPLSAEDLFRNQAGLDASSTGVGTSRPMIRGLYDARVLILVDGIKLSEQRAGGNHALSIDPAMVERVEVVRGPSSVLYGSDAIGGVINFITKKHKENSGDELRFGGEVGSGYDSAHQAIMTNAYLHGGQGSVNYFFNGSFKDTGKLETPSGKLEHSQTESYHYAGGMNYVWGKGFVDLRYMGSRMDLGVPMGKFKDFPKAKFDDEMHNALMSTYEQRDITETLTKIKWDNAVQQHNRRMRIVKPDGKKIEIDVDFTTVTLEPQLTWSLGRKHRLTTGIQYLHEFEKSARRHPSPTYDGVGVIPDSNRLGLGLYAQNEFFVHRRFDLLAGLRYDFFRSKTQGESDHPVDHLVEATTEQDQNVSGNLGVVYRLIPEHWNVTANVGRAFRAPTLHERFFFGPHQETVDQGNPDLDPETSWNFDVGSKVQSEWIKGQLGFFYNYIQDYIQQYPTDDPDDDPWSWENIHDAALYGVELDLELPLLSWISLKGYMTLVRGENLDGGDLVDIPPVKGSYGVRLSYKWKRDSIWLEFMANSVAQQDRTGKESIEPTPGYTTFDLRAGGKLFSGLSFSLYGKNLADKGYNDHLSRVDQLKYNQPGLSLGGSVKYRF